jgi:hypothetical protein
MLIADIPGNLIFLIVFAAVGVVNWWLERKKKQAADADAENPPPRRPQARPAGGSPSAEGSEQERLRRFLEALGVPGEPQDRPQRPQPERPAPRPMRDVLQPPRPKTTPRTAPAPMKPESVQSPWRPTPAPRRAEYPRPRVVRPAPAPEAPKMAEPAGFDDPSAAIEAVRREFDQNTIGEFHFTEAHAGPAARPAVVSRNAAAPIVESLRLALRSPADLRTAFVTMELLGKPRGLQN